MFDIYFVGGYDKKRLLATVNSNEDIQPVITDFLKKHNYKSYYTRVWEENGIIIYDVGCHTQFFHVERRNLNEN